MNNKDLVKSLKQTQLRSLKENRGLINEYYGQEGMGQALEAERKRREEDERVKRIRDRQAELKAQIEAQTGKPFEYQDPTPVEDSPTTPEPVAATKSVVNVQSNDLDSGVDNLIKQYEAGNITGAELRDYTKQLNTRAIAKVEEKNRREMERELENTIDTAFDIAGYAPGKIGYAADAAHASSYLIRAANAETEEERQEYLKKARDVAVFGIAVPGAIQYGTPLLKKGAGKIASTIGKAEEFKSALETASKINKKIFGTDVAAQAAGAFAGGVAGYGAARMSGMNTGQSLAIGLASAVGGKALGGKAAEYVPALAKARQIPSIGQIRDTSIAAGEQAARLAAKTREVSSRAAAKTAQGISDVATTAKELPSKVVDVVSDIPANMRAQSERAAAEKLSAGPSPTIGQRIGSVTQSVGRFTRSPAEYIVPQKLRTLATSAMLAASTPGTPSSMTIGAYTPARMVSTAVDTSARPMSVDVSTRPISVDVSAKPTALDVGSRPSASNITAKIGEKASSRSRSRFVTRANLEDQEIGSGESGIDSIVPPTDDIVPIPPKPKRNETIAPGPGKFEYLLPELDRSRYGLRLGRVGQFGSDEIGKYTTSRTSYADDLSPEQMKQLETRRYRRPSFDVNHSKENITEQQTNQSTLPLSDQDIENLIKKLEQREINKIPDVENVELTLRKPDEFKYDEPTKYEKSERFDMDQYMGKRGALNSKFGGSQFWSLPQQGQIATDYLNLTMGKIPYAYRQP